MEIEFLAALGLCCYVWALSSCGEGGYSLVAMRGLLIAVASLFVELGSVVVGHGLSCPVAYGIFPDQGLNPCCLHWWADSQPLDHQGSLDWYL